MPTTRPPAARAVLLLVAAVLVLAACAPVAGPGERRARDGERAGASAADRPGAQRAPRPTGGADARRGATYAAPLARAIADLRVRPERRDGYDRDLFRHWVDADGDGCDTRDEVLLAEAVEQPPVGAGCALGDGRWRSWYDARTWRDPSDLDIDHVVALAEAWDSGAGRWDDRVRERFANDLGDARALVAVTDEVNAAKSDRDPAEWLPERRVCRYATWWVAAKHRWRLAADAAERSALESLADGCGTTVRVTRAR